MKTKQEVKMILELENICFERENKIILDNINLKIELG